jgi:hypothetical protein
VAGLGASGVIALAMASSGAALADDVGAASPVDSSHELETKYIFGFTTGADIGVPRELSIEFETTAAFQKRGGHYSAVEQEIELEGVPTDFFSYELSAHGSYQAAGERNALDLTNFERYQFNLKFEKEF